MCTHTCTIPSTPCDLAYRPLFLRRKRRRPRPTTPPLPSPPPTRKDRRRGVAPTPVGHRRSACGARRSPRGPSVKAARRANLIPDCRLRDPTRRRSAWLPWSIVRVVRPRRTGKGKQHGWAQRELCRLRDARPPGLERSMAMMLHPVGMCRWVGRYLGEVITTTSSLLLILVFLMNGAAAAASGGVLSHSRHGSHPVSHTTLRRERLGSSPQPRLPPSLPNLPALDAFLGSVCLPVHLA